MRWMTRRALFTSPYQHTPVVRAVCVDTAVIRPRENSRQRGVVLFRAGKKFQALGCSLLGHLGGTVRVQQRQAVTAQVEIEGKV